MYEMILVIFCIPSIALTPFKIFVYTSPLVSRFKYRICHWLIISFTAVT